MILELNIKENEKKSYKSKIVLFFDQSNAFLYFSKNLCSTGGCIKKNL